MCVCRVPPTLLLPLPTLCRATIRGNGAGYIQTKGSQNKAGSRSGVQGETGQIFGRVTLWGLLIDKPRQTQEILWAENSERLNVHLKVAYPPALSLLCLCVCLGPRQRNWARRILPWTSVAVFSFFRGREALRTEGETAGGTVQRGLPRLRFCVRSYRKFRSFHLVSVQIFPTLNCTYVRIGFSVQISFCWVDSICSLANLQIISSPL